jgi:hypothetical protein
MTDKQCEGLLAGMAEIICAIKFNSVTSYEARDKAIKAFREKVK